MKLSGMGRGVLIRGFNQDPEVQPFPALYSPGSTGRSTNDAKRCPLIHANLLIRELRELRELEGGRLGKGELVHALVAGYSHCGLRSHMSKTVPPEIRLFWIPPRIRAIRAIRG